MASSNGVQATPHPQLGPHETALLELASLDSTDRLSLSEKESQIRQLYDRIQEQDLEKALLEQDLVGPIPENVEEQLAMAERDLLEARATYSVRRRVIESVLMTDPSIQSVHSTHTSPAQRALLPLINRRDLLSLIRENLAHAHEVCLEALANAEVQNIRAVQENQALVRTLFELTKVQKSRKEDITDAKLKSQLEMLEMENRTQRANWVTIKRVVSAAIVASGVDWASDEKLQELVIEESIDEM